MHVQYLASACLVIGLLSSTSQAQEMVVGSDAVAACSRAAMSDDNKLDEGLSRCTQALEQPNIGLRDRAITYVNRAVIRMRAGDNDGALADASMCVQLMPGLSEGHVNRGVALLNLNRPQEALEAINTGLDLGNENEHLAYYNRAMVKYRLGDIPGAYYDFRTSADLRPTFELANEALGRFQVTPITTISGS